MLYTINNQGTVVGVVISFDNKTETQKQLRLYNARDNS